MYHSSKLALRITVICALALSNTYVLKGVEDCPPPGCPIIIDLDDNGYLLVGLASNIQFDFEGNGAPRETGWTAGGTRDAFLTLDRNRNGQIDNGLELFGNRTPLSNGQRAEHGFEALAEFDQPSLGGNGDRAITAGDSIWKSLLLWTDSNHNGRSEAGELQNLDSVRIIRFETRYKESKRVDEHGNEFPVCQQSVVSRSRQEEGQVPSTQGL
jgi:hypothetical protein